MSDLFADGASLLAAYGISAAEQPMITSGYSGARHSSFVQGDERYVLKRLRYDDDWLMRVTNDTAHREAAFAVSPMVERLPAGVVTPSLGASYDGDGRAILMRDISELLLPDAVVVPPATMDMIFARIAEMHATFWDDPMADASVPWCGVADRLTLLSRKTGEMLAREGRDFGIERGWDAFDRLAPPPISDLVRALHADMTPLLRILDAFPNTLLHGDLKVGNFGVDDETLWMFDWSSVMVGCAAVDLALLLTMNSSVLPWGLDETIERYAAHLERALGAERFAVARWPAQRDVMMLSGLVYYGWGKALDAAAGRADELRWWCDGAASAVVRFGL